DGERLFSGNPGAWYWQGQVNSIDAQASFPYTPGKFGGAFGSGQVVQQSLSTRPAVLSTKEGIEKDDNSYMGYSIAVGDFTGDGEQGVAAGMPRGAGLLGKVVLFTWNLTNHQNITGTQLGSYFGYSIAVCDVDGDRTDDLIIGAPLHTEPNNEGKYEVGRVYVIYQGEDRKQRFRKFKTLDGINSKSRFGLSVASLGDINLDGYGDFVVGAPYDGPHERGAVYIYHGSKDGVNPKHSQVIFSEDVADPGSAPMSTFGFSVAGGIDLDHNDYPDMAVGAYLSNSAYFFRSRPVVKVNAFVQFLASNKQIILDEKNCTLINGHRVPCTNIDICFNYTGLGVPHNINLDVQYVLDAKKTKDTRMFFIDSENKFTMNDTLQLQRDNRPICRQKMVYIKVR
ncbi:PREDICTED: integrin alpha-PS2-like, partial [Nicrophorus vespilloides]|uniref:Integrin alpha-PS2-like n=1 Tax=Nicrophorus vespilloides TaxID=110193 RepID=A0ABM1M9E1_NICVS